MSSALNSKKVLFISYHFPPDAAVGALRPAKFVKYLPQWGWQPFVLTIQEKHIALKDYARLNEVADVSTTRTLVWPTVLQIALKLRDACLAFRREGQHRESFIEAATMSLRGEDAQTASSLSLFDTLKRYLDSIFELPDKHIGWLVPAVWRGFLLIKKHGIRVVVASSPPRTTALVGLILSYLSNIEFFTDLRDPWYSPNERTTASQTWLSDKMMRWLENKIMERSTRIITTTDTYRSFLNSYYPGIPQNKFLTICNGYDDEDFKALEQIRPGEKFSISYLGTFYFGRTPKPFLNALGELIREGKLDKSRVEVRLIGDVRYAEGESVEDLILLHGLRECVKIFDLVPYEDSLKAMKQSNVLLLFAPDQYYCIPLKAFEYLGSGNSILCFAKSGATAELIEKTESGLVVQPDDVQEIKSALLRLYLEYQSGAMNGHKRDFSTYERKKLALELSQFFEESIS